MEWLFKKAEEFLRRHKFLRRWKKVLAVMMTVVVFSTTYAMILPAITLETEESEGIGLFAETPVYESVSDNSAEPVPTETPEITETPTPTESPIPTETPAVAEETVEPEELPEERTLIAAGADYTVAMTCPAEAKVPKDAVLEVEEILEDDSAYEKYMNDAAAALDVPEKETSRVRARFFDIKITVGGKEFEPAAAVRVDISYAEPQESAAAENVSAVHFAEKDKKPEVVEIAEVTTDEVTEEVSGVSFDADSFSVYGVVYTVDFRWEVDGQTYDYSIRGGDAISLKELLPILQVVTDDAATETDEVQDFVDDIASIGFSDESLVKVVRIEEDTTASELKEAIKNETGEEPEYSANLTAAQIELINAKEFEAVDWVLISMKAFETEETLTVTMNDGEVFVINVTDAQNVGATLDGKTYVISNNGYAMIGVAEEGNGRKDLKSSNNLSDERAPWTFIYDYSKGQYYLKSYDGKFLKFESTYDYQYGTVLRDVTLVDSQNNATAVTIEKENGKYRIKADLDNPYNPFVLQYHENGSYDPFFAGQYAMTGGTEWLTFSEYKEVTLPKDWLLYLDTLENGEQPLDVTIQVGDTLTLRPYTEWVWKHQNEEDQSLQWDFSGWTQGSGYININTGETSSNYKNGYISATTYSNGTITFYKYTRSDREIGESNYPVYRAIATNTGEFYLKTNKGNIVKVTVKSKDEAVTNPTVITNTVSQKVNLFNYDLDHDLDVEGNKASSWNQNGNSAYEKGVNKGSDLKFLGWGAGDSNINAYKINNYTKANPKQGIVSNVLVNGYPELAGNTRINTNKSLKYLFSDEQGNTPDEVFNDIEKHMGVDGLFQKDSDGYYYYNSNMNYAYYDPTTNKFVLYDHTYTQNTAGNGIIGKPMGLFPFHEYNSSKHLSPNHTKELDHHFGMSMTKEFTIPTSNGVDANGHPYIFEFSGDDDMWVYIDGVLVLDVGGIHQPVTGKIDFSTGNVTVQGGGTYDFNNPNAATTSTKYITTIAQQFTNSQTGKTFANADGKTHTLQIFYLERGGCDSNCSIKFNLPSYKTIDLGKRLTGLTSDELAKYKDQVFTYELKVNGALYNSPAEAASNQALKAQRIGSDGTVKEYFVITNGQISIKAGETVRIPHLSETDTFCVAEKSLDSEQFEEPFAERTYTANDGTEHVEEAALTKSHTTGTADNLNDWTTTNIYEVKNTEKVTFANTLKARDLEVEKIWNDSKDHSGTPIKFKVNAKIYTEGQDPKNYLVEALKKSSSSTANDKEFELNQSNNWKYTVENLPVTAGGEDAGKVIIYSVSESTNVNGYTSSIRGVTTDKWNIDAVKLWPGSEAGTKVIKVRLKNKEGKYYAGVGTDGNAVFTESGQIYELNSANGHTYRFRHVPASSSVEDYVVEEVVEQDGQAVGVDMYVREITGFQIINTPVENPDEPDVQEPDVEIHKRIDALRDKITNPDSPHTGEDLTDLYRLYLDYKVNALQDPNGVDLLFVIDHSGSMNNDTMEALGLGWRGNDDRAPTVQDVLNGKGGNPGLIAEFLAMNRDNRWAAVGFKGPTTIGNYVPSSWNVYRPWRPTRILDNTNAGVRDSEVLSPGRRDYIWQSTASSISLPNEGATVLTNYTAGLWCAEQFLMQEDIKGDGKKKVVIFISDGMPTLYINCSGSLQNAGTTNGSYYYPDSAGGCVDETLPQFVNFVNDMKGYGYTFGTDMEFFSIGFGDSLDEGVDLLKNMIAAAYGESRDDQFIAIGDTSQAYNAAEKMRTALQGIIGKAKPYTSFKIEDKLSRYVDLYGLAAAGSDTSDILKAAKVKVTMTNPSDSTKTITLYENGALVAANNTTSGGMQILQSVTYNASTKTVTATFNPNYEAQVGVTYTLSFDVKTTDIAYTTYAASGYDKITGADNQEHVIVGDTDTDYLGTDPDNSTSSDKEGFRSNDSAKVTYTYNGESGEKTYPHPVIQVFDAEIQMLKTDQDGSALANAEFSLYKDAYDTSGTTAAQTANAANLVKSSLKSTIKGEAPNQYAEISVEKLKPGTYYLVETSAPAGYVGTDPIKIVVAVNTTVNGTVTTDTVTVTASVGETALGNDKFSYDSANGKGTLKVMNSNGAELPATGGTGTAVYYLIGMMLVLAAGAIVLMKKKAY